VSLSLYDFNGRQRAEIVNTQHEPGYYSVKSADGTIASGTYVAVLKVGNMVIKNRAVPVR
jgi:hypothetical protein